MKKEIVKVVNIKCGGCEKGIKDALGKLGIEVLEVSHKNQTVSFVGDKDLAIKELARLGYPLAGSKKAKSIFKNAKSYTTCAIGTLKEGAQERQKRTRKFWMLLGFLLV